MTKDIIRCAYGVEVRDVGEGRDPADRTVDVIASTDDIDSHGQVVAQDFDLARYAKNPVLFWSHRSFDKPIGFAEPVSIEGGKLRARLNFVDERANPEAEQVLQGFRQRSIRAVSIGFRPGKVTAGQVDGREVFILSGNELVEISAVGIPANANAVAEERENQLAYLRQKSITAPARAEENDMNLKALLAALALAESATETEVLDRVKALVDTEKSLLEATSKSTGVESIGVVKAWSVTSDKYTELKADLDKAKADAEARERADIIAAGKASFKVTPALEKTLGELTSTAQLKAMVDALPVIPALEKAAKLPDEANKKNASEVASLVAGKKWEDLKPMDKHKLLEASPEAYEVLKSDFEARRAATTSSRHVGAR